MSTIAELVEQLDAARKAMNAGHNAVEKIEMAISKIIDDANDETRPDDRVPLTADQAWQFAQFALDVECEGEQLVSYAGAISSNVQMIWDEHRPSPPRKEIANVC